MVVPRHPRLGRRHLPPEVAVNSGQIALIAAMTTLVGATSPPQIARSAPEPLMPVHLRHRAMVMHQRQCRLLHRHRLLQLHRLHRSHLLGQHLTQRSIATPTRLRHSCAQAAICALIVDATLALARDAGVMEA